MKKAGSLKTCPYCDGPLDEKELSCPSCGKLYWQPDVLPPAEAGDETREEDTMGCFPIFFWPVLISLAVTSILIISGFVFHVFINFEANQAKAVWILGSTAAGALVYAIIVKLKKKRPGSK